MGDGGPMSRTSMPPGRGRGQRVLHRERIVAVVVADRDLGLEAALVHLGAEAEAERGHARQVDLLG
jgi:hypothetical protein